MMKPAKLFHKLNGGGVMLELRLGALVGLVLAFTDAGGGILAVLLLVFGLHLTLIQATTISLIAVGTSAAVGARTVSYRAAAVIGVTGVMMAPFGVWLAHRAPNQLLLMGFLLLLFYNAWRAYRKTSPRPCNETPITLSSSVPCTLNPAMRRLS